MKENKIEISRISNEIIIVARELGLSIIGYWEVAIDKKIIIDYINSYNSSPTQGFMELEEKVILSHGDAKIMFSKNEAEKIINLIKETYQNV